MDFDRVKEKFCEEAEDHFAYVWHHLSEHEKACLQAIIVPKELDQRLLYTAKRLEKRGILVESNDCYKVFSVCFEEFIRNKVDKGD